MKRTGIGCFCLALAVFPFCISAFGQAAPPPFPLAAGFARELPVVARNGMVVSQEARASIIGRDILQRGGNAVDAAVAVGFALAVTLPRAGNLGGGGFMMVHLAKKHETFAIDYRETAPLETSKEVFLDAAGNFIPARSQESPLGTGVPGTVAGLALAHRNYGSGNFTLADLILPALKLAREGMLVDDTLAESLASSAARLGKYPSTKAIFLHEDGSAPKLGETLVQSDLANTLETIARDGEAGFYRGPVADKIASAVQSGGGRMAAADLAEYQALVRPAIKGTYRGHEIVSMPPPSSGGAHVVQILNLMEGFPIEEMGQNSAATIHIMAEAMKLAYADRSKYMGDPDPQHVPTKGLTSKAYADELRKTILLDKARTPPEVTPGNPIPYESDQTTHFSVVDAEGNAVANTYTLNFYYGVGLVAPGTGVLLNNELDDFAAKPGVPNAFGLTGSEANAPGPRKRPLSSMSPTIVLKNGEVEIVTGSVGGSRIITTTVQLISNIIDHKLNVAEAEAAPRMHHQWLPDQLRVERGMSPDTIARLEARGHKVLKSETLGIADTIYRNGGILSGAADSRHRNALAAGY